jgi:hypothetical protein
VGVNVPYRKRPNLNNLKFFRLTKVRPELCAVNIPLGLQKSSNRGHGLNQARCQLTALISWKTICIPAISLPRRTISFSFVCNNLIVDNIAIYIVMGKGYYGMIIYSVNPHRKESAFDS